MSSVQKTLVGRLEETRLRSRTTKWLITGALALVDQGLISGSNFVVGIVLARSLGARQYGAYALAFSTFLLLSLLYHALLLEPMSVFGASSWRRQMPDYLGRLLWLQAIVAAVCIGTLGAVALVISEWGASKELPPALLGIAFASPCVLLMWFARRALYVGYHAGQAALAAILYCGVLFGGLWALSKTSTLSPVSAFLVMGTGALAASTVLLIRLRPAVRCCRWPALAEVARSHWRYGRWALGSAIFIWVPWNCYYTVVTAFFGLSQAGALRALLNLSLPMAQLFAALCLLFLPHTAHIADAEGWKGAKRQAAIIGGIFTATGIVYWGAVILWRAPLIRFLYGGQYANVTSLVPWVALASILSGMVFGPASAFRAMQSPATVCMIFFGSSVIGLAFGIPATHAYGITGAIIGIVLSSIAALCAGIVLLLRQAGNPPHPERPRVAESVASL